MTATNNVYYFAIVSHRLNLNNSIQREFKRFTVIGKLMLQYCKVLPEFFYFFISKSLFMIVNIIFMVV